MPIDVNSDPASDKSADHAPEEAAPTALQRAIRERALARIQAEQNQPRPSLRRKLTVGLLVLLTVTLLLVGIDFSVRVMHRILALWSPESNAPQPPPSLGPDQPYYITVEPPAESASSASSSVGSVDPAPVQ